MLIWLSSLGLLASLLTFLPKQSPYPYYPYVTLFIYDQKETHLNLVLAIIDIFFWTLTSRNITAE